MPILTGAGPIRRTLQYLDAGKLIFKDRVKIVEVHYNMFFRYYTKPKYSDPHEGLREFYFWEVPHIQFKNPNVQIVRFTEMTPLPFIRLWFDDGKDVLVDCDSKDRVSILDQMTKTFGKTEDFLKLEESLRQSAGKGVRENPAIFGLNQKRLCMCEVPDQVPCPGVIDLPIGMQGKFTRYQKDKLEEWENNLDAPYPTQKERQYKNRWFPVKPKPILTDVPGLEKMYMRKPLQSTRPFMAPAVIAKNHEVQPKLDKYFADLGRKVKYI